MRKADVGAVEPIVEGQQEPEESDGALKRVGSFVPLQELLDAAPVSPLAQYIRYSARGNQLRTGFSALFQFLPDVDRTPAAEFRQLVRTAQHTTQTSGYAPGFVQANFVAMHKEYAFDFLSFALRNPKACPLLSVTQTGDPCPWNVAPEGDLRTDIPKYRVYRDGKASSPLGWGS